MNDILDNTPSNAAHAINYSMLHTLWKQIQEESNLRSDAWKFDQWDAAVQHHLTSSELEFYLAPYDNLDMNKLNLRVTSRINHLTKILSIGRASKPRTASTAKRSSRLACSLVICDVEDTRIPSFGSMWLETGGSQKDVRTPAPPFLMNRVHHLVDVLDCAVVIPSLPLLSRRGLGQGRLV
jgi:hypothetical protein